MSRSVHTLLRSRYNGLYKLSLYKLYWMYVLREGHFLDPDSVLSACRSPLGRGMWALDGNPITSYEHFSLASKYAVHTNSVDSDDWEVLHTVVDALYWSARLSDPTSAYVKLEQNNFGKAMPAFHHTLNLPTVNQLFQDTLGANPGIQDFLMTIEGSTSYDTPLMSAFDCKFSLGTGSAFEAEMVEFSKNHGNVSWEAWAKTNHPEVFQYPEGAVPVKGGYYLLDTESYRDFVSFPENLLFVDEYTDPEMPPMAAITGLTGVYTSVKASKTSKFYDCAIPLKDLDHDGVSVPEFSHRLSDELESSIVYAGEVGSFSDISPDVITNYSVPVSWTIDRFTE